MSPTTGHHEVLTNPRIHRRIYEKPYSSYNVVTIGESRVKWRPFHPFLHSSPASVQADLLSCFPWPGPSNSLRGSWFLDHVVRCIRAMYHVRIVYVNILISCWCLTDTLFYASLSWFSFSFSLYMSLLRVTKGPIREQELESNANRSFSPIEQRQREWSLSRWGRMK